MYEILLADDRDTSHQDPGLHLGPNISLTTVPTLDRAVQAVRADSFDLVLLSLELSDGSGINLLNELERSGSDARVLVLSRRSDLQSKLAAFSLGADDYVVTPCEPLELRARVHALLRRANPRDPRNQTLRRGSLIFSLAHQRVFLMRDGKHELPLTPIEFRLLYLLARNEDRILSRAQILDEIWGNSSVIDRTIDTHISNLRRKIRESDRHIRATPGAGYSFQRVATDLVTYSAAADRTVPLPP